MQTVSDLFSANAYTPCQVSNLENGSVGFKIPEYQRPYDWSTSNINRLMTDIFSGFERLSESEASAYTFLGTLILMVDAVQEPKFRGKSYSVVDGQQRLTTLALMSCVLITQLRKLNLDRPKFPEDIEKWLQVEEQHLEAQLADCIYGVQRIRGTSVYPFPRIVRSEDYRSDDRYEEIRSGIGRFLKDFLRYIENDETDYQLPDYGTREGDKLIENYKRIQHYCKSLNNRDWYTEEDCRFLEPRKFECSINLWEKHRDVLGDGTRAAINKIKDNPQSHDFFRTLMLAAYFSKYIVVTTVVTADESAAFDIFDALNTTGEPLTALEVLKPQVISHLEKSYSGSECESAFREIDQIMEKDYPDTKKKMGETKELVVTFSQYLEGRKVSKELGEQRKELRQFFEKSKRTKDGPVKFMNALADVTRYRSDYWVSKNSGRINSYHPEHNQAEEVKLLSAFISDMNTSLALPILARYWIAGKLEHDFSIFIEVLRAVSAFLALRRAATGSTDLIDTCFRDIMAENSFASPSNKKFGLCSGSTHENALLTLDELTKALRDKLSSTKVNFNTKEDWINKVADIPIYKYARPLARFLLFSATHHTLPDPSDPNLLTRDATAPSDNREYFTYANWKDKRYLTLEHVAPQAENTAGWPSEIYRNSWLKDTLGNLVLLPTQENDSISDAPWSKKKIFYSVLIERNINQRNNLLQEAKNEGLQFSPLTENIISSATTFRLSMLDGIETVDEWNADLIQRRSRRLASLAWDVLSPWLGITDDKIK
ncbi:MAG: DUF262 domain-containing HNH endonuclease family protein [Gammaproteobacteria bacterium]|nr:DUF262 domain-containing HNH endonuclease family protein [Gammaproteobacteria bacterium]